MSRQISTAEASVLERTLAVGATGHIAPGMLAAIHTLQVTATCSCGCATVWFGPDGDAANGHQLADALATSDGQNISVLVWAIADEIVGLELVGVGAVPLPDPASVRSYSEA